MGWKKGPHARCGWLLVQTSIKQWVLQGGWVPSTAPATPAVTAALGATGTGRTGTGTAGLLQQQQLQSLPLRALPDPALTLFLLFDGHMNSGVIATLVHGAPQES